MTDRRRFYLTTAIAYANNKPGLHTLYEVVGADVVERHGSRRPPPSRRGPTDRPRTRPQ